MRLDEGPQTMEQLQERETDRARPSSRGGRGWGARLRSSVVVDRAALRLLVVLLVGGCRTGPAPSAPGASVGTATAAAGGAQALREVMAGTYSSAAQAASDPEFKVIELHMTPIWSARSDGAWLYVEQAAAEARDAPYRQRVYQLAEASTPGRVESRVFELPGDPLSFAGAWRDPSRLDVLTPASLVPRQGCTVVVARLPDGTWSGSTLGDRCRSTLRGASYATSEVTISAHELRSWDRGFDAEGKQVWGAVKGPYRFLKQPPER